MSWWNGKFVVHYPPYYHPNYSDWLVVDCYCCRGFEWSVGSEPIQCKYCCGGDYVVHIPTGTVALWPGGPLRGSRLSVTEVNKLVEKVII